MADRKPVCLPPLAAKVTNVPSISFEFFPPKTEKMAENLWESIRRLEPLKPEFVSVTYGAGGSTRERTHDTVVRIARETSLTPAAHLTCVGAKREEVDDIARRYWDAGIHHIVALRGDPPDNQVDYVPFLGGYAYAADLIAGLKRIADFEITVAVYPEIHPQSRDMASEIDNLKRKIDAGAGRAITQAFFDVSAFLRLRDAAAKAGISIPIIPGILPIVSFAQAAKFTAIGGTSIPEDMRDLFEGVDDDEKTRHLVSAMFTADLCRTLVAEGEERLHFFTLNRADLTYAICQVLGVRAGQAHDLPHKNG